MLVSDLDAGDLVVLDAAARKEIKRLALGKMPEGILIPPDGSRAFVAVNGDNNVAVVDLKTWQVTEQDRDRQGPRRHGLGSVVAAKAPAEKIRRFFRTTSAAPVLRQAQGRANMGRHRTRHTKAGMPTIADLILCRLREAGVGFIFGMPGGGSNLDLIAAAGRASVPFVLTATETGAALAAVAQAEVSGRLGVCLTTLGPGVASVVNGVACASLERAPLLVLTDSHPASAGNFTHQRIAAPLRCSRRW